MIKTGSKDLDEFLHSYYGLTCIYGEPGTGKTTCCLLASIAQKKRVVFLDTELKFPIERLKQITDSYNDALDNIFLFKIKNFKDQQLKIKIINKIKDASLIIVDTIGARYRTLAKNNRELANSMLRSQIKILKEISKKVPVIITNQVYTNIDNKEITMIGGKIINNNVDILVKLEKNPRKIKLFKPVEKEMMFEIKEKGIFRK